MNVRVEPSGLRHSEMGAKTLISGLPWRSGIYAVAGMMQIALAQTVAENGEIECAKKRRQAIPGYQPIHDGGDPVE